MKKKRNIAKEIVRDTRELIRRMKAGEAIEVTQVRRVETPDGPMHLRKKSQVRLHRNRGTP